jgi:oligoribonuclease (3'-5' exoribonuclease)
MNAEKPLVDPIVWIDLEMTMLDLEKVCKLMAKCLVFHFLKVSFQVFQGTILEIAVIVTDGKLNVMIEVHIAVSLFHSSVYFTTI